VVVLRGLRKDLTTAMNRIVPALCAILLSSTASAETKRTRLALNWEARPTGENETVNSRARIPGAMVIFIRDIANYSTDTVAIVSDGGAVCRTMVNSDQAIHLICGSFEAYYDFRRVGSVVQLDRVEEVEVAPPATEAPVAPPSPPPAKKTPAKRKAPAPYSPGWSPRTST
jgi:hypothetical protein